MVYIFLAEGFEEIEGLTVVDLLRRANIKISMVSITGKKQITGAHGIKVEADVLFEEAHFDKGEMLVLPGGMPGTNHLGAHMGLVDLLKQYNKEGRKIAAICAAPSVLGVNGILDGKKATCFPGFEEKLIGAIATGGKTQVDSNIITGKGLGTAIDFSLEIIEQLKSKEIAKEIAAVIQYV